MKQILLKCKHGNNIYEHWKQQKQMNQINLFLICQKD